MKTFSYQFTLKSFTIEGLLAWLSPAAVNLSNTRSV